jgi:hypothetical protein
MTILLPHLLAFTPLIDPLPALYPGLDDYWLWFVIPLVIAISIVYKGTRVATIRRLPAEAGLMAAQILILMVVASIALYALTFFWLRAT